MLALALSADGTLDPVVARRKRRPVLFFVGGIHAGEIDGKDAGFALARDLLAGKGPAAALGAAPVGFAPGFNVDGPQRLRPHHRPTQRRPEGTGFPTPAPKLNPSPGRGTASEPRPSGCAPLGAPGSPSSSRPRPRPPRGGRPPIAPTAPAPPWPARTCPSSGRGSRPAAWSTSAATR